MAKGNETIATISYTIPIKGIKFNSSGKCVMKSSKFLLFLTSCLVVLTCTCNALSIPVKEGDTKAKFEDLDIIEGQPTTSTPTYSCVSEDNIVNLSELLNKTVIRPKTFNIRQCVASPDLEKSNQTCAPSVVRDLRTRVETPQGRCFIETVPDLIIESCSIVNKTSNCTLEDRYVNLAEHLGLGELLIRPGYVNIHQCVSSKKLKSENQECVPSAYKPLDTVQLLEHIRGLHVVETIPDVVINGCTIREKVPDCELKSKTVNLQEHLNDNSIVEPESVNVGECVGSPDLGKDKECVPTSTKPINVLRNNSGTLTVDRLQDFVIKKCSIVEKRNSCEISDKFVSFDDYLPFIVHPRIINVRRCRGSNDLLNQNKKCVPTRLQPMDFVLNVNGKLRVDRADNFIIAECGLCSICVVEEYNVDVHKLVGEMCPVLFPTTVNVGKCVRNPECGSIYYDGLQCSPTIGVVDNFTIADCDIVPICELQDHWVDVQDLVDEEECSWPVIFPAKANVGKCVRNPNTSSIYYNDLQCTPTSYESLPVVVFNNDTFIIIEKTNATISSCGPMRVGGGRDWLW